MRLATCLWDTYSHQEQGHKENDVPTAFIFKKANITRSLPSYWPTPGKNRPHTGQVGAGPRLKPSEYSASHGTLTTLQFTATHEDVYHRGSTPLEPECVSSPISRLHRLTLCDLRNNSIDHSS